MTTISSNLTYLKATKDAIKNAIIAKGVTVEDTDTFRSYASKIKQIQSGGSGGKAKLIDGTIFQGSTACDASVFDTSGLTTMENMFNGCKNLTSLDVSGFDTSNVTDMMNMFRDCNNLTSLDVSGFDTSNVTDMSCFVFLCNNLTSLDVSGFDTSNVTDMSSMFGGCWTLTSLDLRGFDTSNVTRIYGMFNDCNNLTSLDLSNFDTSKVTSMSYMFNDCNKLASLIGSHTLEEVEAGTITALNGLKVSLDLSSTALDRASLLAVIKGLATVTSTTKLTLGSTLLAKLTNDDKKIATDKGWTLA